MKNKRIACIILIIATFFYVAFIEIKTNIFKDYIKTLINDQENRISNNVYLIIVDGLRYDSVEKDMPNILKQIYEDNACLIKAHVIGPSISRPGYARILTGAPTSINGIYKNSQDKPCRIPSIFQIAKESNLTTGASAYYWIAQLFNSRFVKDNLTSDLNQNIQYSFFYSSENKKDDKIFEMGNEIIKKYHPNLMLIHPMETDIVGHKWGAKSSQYESCVRNVDDLILQFLKNVDFKDTTVIITSDHGHKDKGGHGGTSPEEIEVPVIIIGKSIKRGIYSQVIYQEDIAPTICAILNIPFSPYMTGKVIDFVFKEEEKEHINFLVPSI